MFDPTLNQMLASRRAFLTHSIAGMGTLALQHLLGRSALAGDASGGVRVPGPHHPPRAKSVICLFQHGGPSQMDLFDHKPELSRLNGQAYSGELEVHFVSQNQGKVLGSPFKFSRHGASGLELSELLPHTGTIADDLTLVRSMVTDSVDHEQALRVIHAGKTFPGRPTWGAWGVYGLGAIRDELPAYVVLSDPGGHPVDGPHNWSSGFLPAKYQGTVFKSDGDAVSNLRTPDGVSPAARANQLAFLNRLNESHLAHHPHNTELSARIRDFELAAQMQLSVPEIIDLSDETAETRALYGLDDPATAEYGKRCVLARRLIEKGVRFVQLFLGGQPWDTHDKNASRLKSLASRVDRPSAALVQDLKRRGLLDSTVVLWTGEFGRLPVSQGADGRDHNRHAFSLWLAGGGFKRGYAHGATDDFGYKSVQDVVRVVDLQATLLHVLGLDHTRLTWPHSGREESLTDAAVTKAHIVPELLA
ncbi:MAG TPA: DUF1501 domain-containing protein [Planctomycetaceae bacterium]|nr:DUF1501 domain-containing protein [Planctomycetaceae bacterium]